MKCLKMFKSVSKTRQATENEQIVKPQKTAMNQASNVNNLCYEQGNPQYNMASQKFTQGCVEIEV